MASYAPSSVTYGVDRLLLDPPALPRPSDRRLILGFLLALAAGLHLATASWGQLYNGPEGWHAAAARLALNRSDWWQATDTSSPLLNLSLIASFRIFGVHDWAARIPIALATISTVWLIFIIGERLGGTWRGFAAGCAALFSPGFFIIGRSIGPDPLGAALICGTVYCTLRGFRMRRRRRWWYRGTWLCAAGATLAIGAAGWLVPLILFGSACLFYRECRIRCRTLLSLEGLLLFLLVQSPWFYTRPIQPLFAALEGGGPVSYPWLRLGLWMFPWSLLFLIGAAVYAKRLVQHRTLEFREALPWLWAGAAALIIRLAGGPNDFASLTLWCPAALAAAATWSILRYRTQIVAVVLILIVSIPVCIFAEHFLIPAVDELTEVPADAWAWFQWLGWFFSGGMLFFSALAVVFTVSRHQRLPLMALAAATLPLGFALLELRAKLAPYFSCAEVAEFLNNRAELEAGVIFAGTPMEGSSLRIYTDRSLVCAEPPKGSEFAPERPVYLVCEKSAASYWPKLKTIFVGTRYAVLSNTKS